jgi:hypothetical protein
MSFLKNLFGKKDTASMGDDPAKVTIEQLQESTGWLQALVNPRTGQRMFVLHVKASGSTDVAPREFSTIDDVPNRTILLIAPRAKKMLTDYPSLARRVVFQDSGPENPPIDDGVIDSILDKLKIAYATLAKSKRDAVAIIWYDEGLNFLKLMSLMSAPASGVEGTTK